MPALGQLYHTVAMRHATDTIKRFGAMHFTSLFIALLIAFIVRFSLGLALP
jgi:hypothetical protein